MEDGFKIILKEIMNPYAQEGDKVIFNAEYGEDWEKRYAEMVLNVGDVYTVNQIILSHDINVVELKEFLGMWWNTGLFEDSK